MVRCIADELTEQVWREREGGKLVVLVLYYLFILSTLY